MIQVVGMEVAPIVAVVQVVAEAVEIDVFTTALKVGYRSMYHARSRLSLISVLAQSVDVATFGLSFLPTLTLGLRTVCEEFIFFIPRFFMKEKCKCLNGRFK